MCLVSAVLGIVVVLTEVLCSWTGSDTDRSTDQSSFAEAHSAVIDCQVPHTAHIGLLGGDALWEEMIWSSTDEHWLFGICGAGIQRSHHMVDLRVHIQLDNVGISDHCDSVPVASTQTLSRRHLCEELMCPIVHNNHHCPLMNVHGEIALCCAHMQ